MEAPSQPVDSGAPGAAIHFALDVPVGPQWKNIDLLRVSILNCLTTLFQDSDYCQSVGMVASELLENAVKYGAWDGQGQRWFNLKVHGDQQTVTVEVENPVDPDSGAARRLMDTVEWINSFTSPEAAYLARMQQLASAGGELSEESRLGLVRVAYEGACRLKAEQRGGVLRVSATSSP